MNLKEDWKNALDLKRAVHIPQALDYQMQWSEAIELLDLAASKVNTDGAKIWKDFEKGNFTVIGECATRHFGFFQSSFPENYSDKITIAVDSIIKEIDSPTRTDAGQIFANFISSYGYESTPHRDNWPVLYLQLVNSVVWEIYDFGNLDDVKQEIKLNAGDALLIPKGTVHNVKVIEPRFSLSFGFGDSSAFDESVYTEYIES